MTAPLHGNPPEPIPVLRALAMAFARSKAGRTGQQARDFQIDLKALLTLAHATDGDHRALAITTLQEADQRGLLTLDRHRRDRDLIERVRIPAGREAALFDWLHLPAPGTDRARLAETFRQAAGFPCPPAWATAWQQYCTDLAGAALAGTPIAPFNREDPDGNAELLRLLPQLLAWEGESLVRFASCVLCGDSKRLQSLAPRLESALAQITAGRWTTLEHLGLIQTPRSVLVHGPLQLELPGGTLDLGLLSGPYRISANDITTARTISTGAPRCLTVENETTFHELAKLQSRTLLICTTHPGSATLALLHRLPPNLECHHFGDADPAGYDILRQLREKTGRPFPSLGMEFRPTIPGPPLTSQESKLLARLRESTVMSPESASIHAMLIAGHKGLFEQEQLGRPTQPSWPFFTATTVTGGART